MFFFDRSVKKLLDACYENESYKLIIFQKHKKRQSHHHQDSSYQRSHPPSKPFSHPTSSPSHQTTTTTRSSADFIFHRNTQKTQNSINMLNSLQGATLIAINALVTKLFMTSTVRLYSILYPTDKSDKAWAKSLGSAQLNEAEYAAYIMAPLFFLSYHHSTTSNSSVEPATYTATLATLGQVSYFWIRLVFGYPSPAIVAAAVARYAGIALICMALYNAAF